MVRVLLPFLSPLAKPPFLTNEWDSTNIAEQLRVPILSIAGDEDEIVPFTQMKDLYAKSSKSSLMHRFHSVRGSSARAMLIIATDLAAARHTRIANVEPVF